MKRFSFAVFLLLLMGSRAVAQVPAAPLSLDQVIDQALAQSSVARQAQTNRETSYWQWRTYRANYRPQLALQGALPGYTRKIDLVTQNDGSTAFKPVRYNSSNLAATLTQNIGFTGGQVMVASEMLRYDNFNTSERNYNSRPIGIGITQPIGGYNTLRWARQIEPLRYQESQRLYVEERENIAQRITELYFDVLLQQVNASVARQNVQANEDMFRLGQERYKLGRLSQSDLLLLELNLLNSRKALGQALLEAQSAAVSLQSYTGLSADALQLAIPAAAPRFPVATDQALALARQNRRESLEFRRRLLQAESEVARAKGTTGFQASLVANVGFVNQAPSFWSSYNNPDGQQEVRLSFSVPILDWGRQKSIVKTAALNRQQVQQTVAQEQQTFEQSVLTQAAQLSSLNEQLDLAARADTLAQRRYDIARATYQVGRISLTDLNIALSEKDQAKRAYIAALRASWVAHYRLRALTLYDFERQQPLLAGK